MSTRARRARSAVTRVTFARHFKGVSLIKVAIATGRTHQIRVHLSAIGHPIVGDQTYGGVHRRVGEQPARGAAARAPVPARLPARRSRIPGDGRRVEFDSPLPPELEAVIEAIAARREDEPLAGLSQNRMTEPNALHRTHLRRQGLRRRSRPRAHAERPRGHRGCHPAPAVGRDRAGARTGQVILIRQYRYAVNQWLWELPAGSVDEGETPEQAARRECHEEIGQLPDTVVRLGAMFPTPGYCDEEMFFFRRLGPERARARRRSRTKTRTSRSRSSR